MICKILFSFSVPLDPVQIEVLKEKEKEEREKWSFWPKQPLISQLFRNKIMTKIEIWSQSLTNMSELIGTETETSPLLASLAFMQWMQLFCRFSENIALLFPLIPFANICGIVEFSSSVLVCIPAEALVLKFVDYIFQNLRKYCQMPKTSNQVEKHLKCIVSEHHHGSRAVFCFCTRQTNCGTVSRFAATIIVPNGSKAIKLNDNCFLLDPK